MSEDQLSTGRFGSVMHRFRSCVLSRRMVKEVQSYEKEAVAQENKIAKMREEGRDPYDIKKQEVGEACL